MNQPASISIGAIKNALPLVGPPGQLLLLVAFGSQIRNTQTPHSDLDLLLVARTDPERVYEGLCGVLAGARGGVQAATILAHTPQTLEKYSSLYGMPEYGALRGHRNGESDIIYRADDACSVLDAVLASDVGGCPADDGHNPRPDTDDAALWARRWLDRSKRFLSDGQMHACGTGAGADGSECSSDGDEGVWISCSLAYESITCAIKSCLLHHGIRFPFTRDVDALHAMLPPGSRTTLDVNKLKHWGNRHMNHTRDDAKAALEAAGDMHALVSALLPTDPPPGINDCIGSAPPPIPMVFRMPAAGVAAGMV